MKPKITVGVGKDCLVIRREGNKEKFGAIIFEGKEEIKELFSKLGELAWYYSNQKE